MATLSNSRNSYLASEATRILGASVYITSGVATSFVITLAGTSTLPGVLLLTAISGRYVDPQYVWSRRFADTGSFTTISGATSSVLEVTGDYSFITAAGTSSIVQYRVEVSEGGTLGINPSSYIITLPILRQGAGGITVSISNTAYLLPSDNDGTILTYANSGTSIQVFEGSTPLVYRTTLGTNLSSFTLGTPTLAPLSGITVGARSGNGTNTATVSQHSAMGGAIDTVLITYPITYARADGTQETQKVTQSITKAKAGTLGIRGSRQLYSTDVAYTSAYTFSWQAAGAASYAAKATSLIATATVGSTPITPITGDTVTFSNSTNYVYTITYVESGWVPPGTVIDGSLLVTGSVTAAKINSTGLIIRDNTSSIILDAGSGTFSGALSAATGTFNGSLSAATGTFAGSLSAATGTFAGALSAVTGTFSGALTADAVNAVNTINLAGNSVTVPSSSYTAGAIAFDSGSGDVKSVQSVTVPGDGQTQYMVTATFGVTHPSAGQVVRVGIGVNTTSGFSVFTDCSIGAGSVAFLHTPSASTTYHLNAIGLGTSAGTLSNRSLVALGVKR